MIAETYPAAQHVLASSALWFARCAWDANTALRLVASELSKDLDMIEFTESVWVNALREALLRSKSLGCYGHVVASGSA